MILCARCDAVVEHLNALLGHYQEVHGGVPKMITRVYSCTEIGYPIGVRSESSVESIVAMPYLSKPPSSSSVRLGPDNSFRHDWRAS